MAWIPEEVKKEVEARDRLVKPLAQRCDELEAENRRLRERVTELESERSERLVEATA